MQTLRVIQMLIAFGFISEILAAFGELKISGGNYSGRLEFRRSSGSWVSVCRDGFDDDAANVACRQLGYVKSSDIYTFDEYVNTIALLLIYPLGPNLRFDQLTHSHPN